MKKGLFFAIIASFAFLSACNSVSENYKQEDKSLNVIEDTLAHEEIFGESTISFKKENTLKAPSFLDVAAPALGIQSQESGSNIHIRFVAAIELSNSVGDTTAVWTRTVYKGGTGDDRGSVFRESQEKASTKAYLSLKNGASTLTIAQFNETNHTSYDCFVVYTVLNVPKATYASYCITAFVTIDGIASKVLGTRVDQTAQAAFLSTDDGYFLKGKISDEGDLTPILGGGNNATFNVHFSANDNFVICLEHLAMCF